MRKDIFTALKNNRGMTMMEVLMGFLVLVVFLGGISGIISFSSKMVFRSIDLKKDLQTIQGELYKSKDSRRDKNEKDNIVFTLKVDLNDDANKYIDNTKFGALLYKESTFSADLYEVNSTFLRDNFDDIDISEEGLDISIYGLEAIEQENISTE